jgi:branched-subunit amino acid transport protein AzlD
MPFPIPASRKNSRSLLGLLLDALGEIAGSVLVMLLVGLTFRERTRGGGALRGMRLGLLSLGEVALMLGLRMVLSFLLSLGEGTLVFMLFVRDTIRHVPSSRRG